MWKNKYEALAKLYSQLRKEHIDLLNKYKQLQVKANSANEATEKLERMQADMRAKNTELADLIRERDRARNELARLQGVKFIKRKKNEYIFIHIINVNIKIIIINH